MPTPHRPIPLVIIVLSLIVAGALLFAAVRELSADLGPGPDTAARLPELHEAAERGETERVRELVRRGVAPDEPLTDAPRRRAGMTPLMLALENGHTGTARALLEAGARTDSRGQSGQTPLILAAGWSDTASVDALLRAGARVDARNNDQWTALMMAAARGELETVRRLIAEGANVNARNRWGQTALMLAAFAGDADKISALLEAGAEADARDNDGQTALMIASGGHADFRVVRRLVETDADVNAADQSGLTALMRAAERADGEKVGFLLGAGADAARTDSAGRTALDWARIRDDDRGREIADLIRSASRD